MTEERSPEEADWKLLVRGLKQTGTPEARMLVEKTVLEAGGTPLRLREARRQLFILTAAVCGGRPAIIEAAAGLVCLIALDDLVEVVFEPGPTLGEVMRKARAEE